MGVYRDVRCLTVCLAGMLFGSISAGQALRWQDREGVQEMVIASSDIDATERFWRSSLGYSRLHGGRSDPKLALVWGLSRPGLLGRERLIGVRGSAGGWLRLVEIPPEAAAVRIRSSARPFDSGGIFNFNVLVKDIDSVFEALRVGGGHGYADPNRYEIFGRRYAGALVVGPDGAVVNLLQRVDQSYEDVPRFARASHIINATQVVRDFGAAQAFFRDQLGWTQRWEAAPAWPADGSNNMGLPQSLVKSGAVRERAASFALRPDARGGTVEILAFEGVQGADLAARARAPNTGLLAYRIRVADITNEAARLRARGVRLDRGLEELTVAPYGRVRMLRVVAPDGAWLEFFSELEAR